MNVSDIGVYTDGGALKWPLVIKRVGYAFYRPYSYVFVVTIYNGAEHDGLCFVFNKRSRCNPRNRLHKSYGAVKSTILLI